MTTQNENVSPINTPVAIGYSSHLEADTALEDTIDLILRGDAALYELVRRFVFFFHVKGENGGSFNIVWMNKLIDGIQRSKKAVKRGDDKLLIEFIASGIPHELKTYTVEEWKEKSSATLTGLPAKVVEVVRFTGKINGKSYLEGDELTTFANKTWWEYSKPAKPKADGDKLWTMLQTAMDNCSTVFHNEGNEAMAEMIRLSKLKMTNEYTAILIAMSESASEGVTVEETMAKAKGNEATKQTIQEQAEAKKKRDDNTETVAA